MGANGSGKSTLVRALTGLRPLTSGSVRLFGTPLADFHDHAAHRLRAAASHRDRRRAGQRARGRGLRPADPAQGAAPDGPRRPAGDHRRARGRRARAPRRRRDLDPQRRPAAAGADRPRAGGRARPVLPRRADRRRRPAQPAGAGHGAAARCRSAGPRSCWSPTSSARWPPSSTGPSSCATAGSPTTDRRSRRRPCTPTTTDAAASHDHAPHVASPLDSLDGGPMSLLDLLGLDFMHRALLAALFTGLAAPAIGTFLVQKRLALLGDGIGHIAVTGVALGLLTGTSPTWTAVVVAILGAVLIEVIREQRPHQRRRGAGPALLRRARRRRAHHRPRRPGREQPQRLPLRLGDQHLARATCGSRWRSPW